ncbi:hypothetical protein QJQ45_005125 [Haematococcus lacustris]|nr:hypothetical protein QJQ45_005125 [Haematococcus lacustris]
MSYVFFNTRVMTRKEHHASTEAQEKWESFMAAQDVLTPMAVALLTMAFSLGVMAWALRGKERLRLRLLASGAVWTAHEGIARRMYPDREAAQQQVDDMSEEQVALLVQQRMAEKAKPQVLLRGLATSTLTGLFDGRLLGLSTPNQVVPEEGVDDGLCVICYDKPSSCVFLDCGHGGFCKACAYRIFVRPPNECPTCRQHIEQVVELEEVRPTGQVSKGPDLTSATRCSTAGPVVTPAKAHTRSPSLSPPAWAGDPSVISSTSAKAGAPGGCCCGPSARLRCGDCGWGGAGGAGLEGTQRVLLSVAAARGWELQQLDVETAFLNAPVDEGRLVCQQPPGFETGQGLVCQLDKAVYGLLQAPRAWYQHLTQQLGLIGFTASAADPCLFSLRSSKQPVVHLMVYVDDIILASPSSTTIAAVKQQLQQVFSLHDLGPAASFLGTRLVKEGSPLDSSSAHRYRELVGALLYASTCTRPDIAFAVGQLSRFMQAPTQQHQQVAFGLLRYLKRTAKMGLVYSRSSSSQLQGYVDADYAGDPDSMRSTTGSVFVFNGAAVTWRSKLQTTVAASTTEAEYQAAAAGTKEALFLRKLLHELEADCDPIPILCDNQGAVALIKNPVESHRSRHIAVAHHISRERMVRGEVMFSHCPAAEMVVDALTKPLSAQLFEACVRGMGVG